MDEKILDLGQIRNRSGRVRLEDGTQHDVFPTKGRTYRGLRAATKEEAVDKVYAAAKECIPSATAEQIDELTLEQANAVLAIAGAGIAAVEALYPNAVSPATSTSPG